VSNDGNRIQHHTSPSGIALRSMEYALSTLLSVHGFFDDCVIKAFQKSCTHAVDTANAKQALTANANAVHIVMFLAIKIVVKEAMS
jgi:DNA-binding protein